MLGGRIVAAWLKAQGVEKIFALSGEHILPLFDGCKEEGIEVIATRHEQAAVLAAEAYARVTGRPGVAAVTAGPGVTNAVTGLAVANTSGSPVMLLAGRTSTGQRLRGTFQDVDGTAITRPVTKWAETVFDAERIPVYLETGWRKMLGGRPGAVFLELPHNVLKANPEGVAINKVVLEEPAGAAPEALAKALQMLGDAEKPMIIAGGGAFWAGAGEALRAFSERTMIPVATLNAARGLLPDGAETCIGPMAEAGLALLQSDVMLILGTKFDASVTFGGPPLFSGNEKIIQVDIEPTSFGLNRMSDLAVHGDVRVVLQQLTDGWDAKPKDEWCRAAKDTGQQMHAAWEASTQGEGSPVPPGRVCGEVIKEAGRDAILISDGGDSHTWAITTFPAYQPGSYLHTHDSLGTIGVGVPFALGAKAAAPDRPVVLCIGDGSFGFGAMELETAARAGLPFTAVIMNNGGWGNIRHEQGRQFSETNATELSVASYEKIAEAVGGYGERVDDAAQVGAAIRRAIDSGKPAVVNVITQPGVVSEITKMVGDMMTML
jgi:thiamine pyrophosphate-dependent acetolactate synthase large subunit-like protein